MSVVVDDIWTPYKELQSLVETAIAKPTASNFEELQHALLKHKQNFLTLLKNPPKNETFRQNLKKGTVDNVEISKELVAETIILSDMYELNEYLALDLLGTAQQQSANYPDLPRGVIAVLLYYDGRKALVSALRNLVQARSGNLWTVDTSPQVSELVTKYTDELVQDGLIPNLLNLLDTLDLDKEKELLQKNKALGPPRYRQEVFELFESTKQCLAEVIFLFSAQSGLPKEPAFALLNHLRNRKGPESGPVDDVSLTLTLAFLYAIDLSLLHKEDGDVIQRNIPLVMGGSGGGQYIQAMQAELTKSNGQNWLDEGLQSVILLGWAMTLSSLRMAPQLVPQGINLNNPDLVAEEAIQSEVFDYLYKTFLTNEMLYKEEFMVRRMHNLVTDFISQMPHKTREMRLRAEETDRTIQAYFHEGLQPPKNLPHHFEHLLLTVAQLYKTDELNLQLEVDYWYSAEGRRLASFPFRAQPKREALSTFVMLSDNLPKTLFVPYLKMLTSLASCKRGAQQCYNFIKNNENKSFTWDHFFASFNMYFNNLRQEARPAMDTVYRVYNQTISVHEREALEAVLDLIKAVAENDPVTGEKMCQNQQWAPMTVLLGLVTCSVPIPLKASLLYTLAAFAKSPATAASLWHNIEASQIITTVPSTSNFQPRGIQTELEEVECRNEEYPLTKAVLHLLNCLTDKPIPKLLGASQRIPGFDPYLNFILNSVLFRFAGRGYKNPKEKWEVCEGAMSLISKLLLQYDPMKDEFLSKHVQAYSIGTAQINPPPGYHIMITLCSKSELLRLILLLIDEGCQVFDSYPSEYSLPGKKELEACIIHSLRMLEHGLAIQQQFISLLNASNSNILLVGLNRLLLGVNEVTNKPDHLLNIAKYLTYQSWLPLHSLPAINVLLLVTSYSTPHGHLLSLFISTPQIKAAVRHGFVSCLEAEEEIVEGSEDEDALMADEDDERRVVTKTKKSICLFLLQNLNQGVPNVAHYLFGFDLNKEIRKTVFQQPGVLGAPRSCLHSIISLLDSNLINPDENSGSLVELYYRILYSLAYNTRTSEPTLRFLRSSGDFLKKHLAALPFCSEEMSTDSELRQMSWLLKTVAIEMKITAASNQRSQLALMVETFTGGSKEREGGDSSMRLLEKMKQSNQLVLRLIKHARFIFDPVSEPFLELIDMGRLKKLMKDCEIDEGRIKTVDIRSLHILLENELNVHNRGTVSNSHKREIQVILSYVTKVNAASRLNVSTVKFLDAWRQATEVMFAVAAQNVLQLEERFNLLVDIIHELLVKAVQCVSQTEIAILISGSILLLCVDLRQTYISEIGKGEETDSKLCNFMDSNSYKLSTITTNLIKWILSSGAASQKLRANLYSALLNFLHLSREKTALKHSASSSFMSSTGVDASGRSMALSTSRNNYYVSLLDRTSTSMTTGATFSDRNNIEVVLAHGERLVDMLCHDCSTSHDICKMLALACLDMVVELDANTTWTSVLSSRGYLKYIIDSLLEADKHLLALLSANVTSLKQLYVYESKMALLCRIASTRIGAEMLLEQNTLSCLSALQAFNKHPDIVASVPLLESMDMDFVPDVSTRYLQILSPALGLCDSIISSMGVENQLAIIQVLKFLLCHGEMVTLVLRSGNPFHRICYQKELAQLTGVIARATNDGAFRALSEDGIDPGSLLESSSFFNRVQRLMLGLISRFVISESLLRDLEKEAEKSAPSDSAAQAKADSTLTFLQIAAHLLLYARNVVSSGAMDRRISTVVFQPAMNDSSIPDRRDMLTMQEATLGVVVQQLVQAVAHHQREKSNLDLLLRKLESVPEMNAAVVKQYVDSSNTELTGDLEESRRQATRVISQQVENKMRELQLCHFIIEHCMFIVWAHLDFYMLRGLSNKTLGLPSTPSRRGADGASGTAIMEFDVTWSVTSDDLNHLKQGLLSVFNDTFSNSLISTVQDLSEKEKGFLSALLRRIKKLIQFVPS